LIKIDQRRPKDNGRKGVTKELFDLEMDKIYEDLGEKARSGTGVGNKVIS
jgi:hypothetical protein